MKIALQLTAAVLALGVAACNPGGNERAANVAANEASTAATDASDNEAAQANQSGGDNQAAAGNGAAASICLYDRDDVKDWQAVEGKANTRTADMIIVTGKAHVGDPKYKAQLTKTGVAGGVLRLWLTQAANDDEEETPADGWYDLRYGPGERGISKVVVWCDHDTDLVELDVEPAK